MRDFARRHPISTYVTLAYTISWAYWIPQALRGTLITQGSSVTHFPGLLGPAAAAFIVTGLIDGWRGTLQLLRRVLLIVPPVSRFWLYSMSPLAVLALAIAAAGLTGRLPETDSLWRYSGLPDAFSLPVVLLLVLVFNGFGEETGWRGYALHHLQARFGPLKGTVVLGLVWAGWHIPTFWTIEGYRSMGVPALLFGFGFGVCAGSVVLARIANRTAPSILGVALWHALYNMGSATAGSRGIIGVITTMAVLAWAAMLFIQEHRRQGGASLLLAKAAT